MSLLKRSILHSGRLFTLSVVRCLHPGGGPGREEETGAHSIDLPLSGVFVRHVEGARVVGSPGSVLFYNRGEIQRVSHPAGPGDRCLSLGIADDVARDAAGESGGRASSPFPRRHLPADPAWAAALHHLRHRLESGAADGLEVEETGLALFRRLSGTLAGDARRSKRRGVGRRRRERVEAVQVLIAADPLGPWSLTTLARAADSSPFHLSRSFTQEVGVPLHRWVVRQRLLLSLEEVAGGSRRLVDVALDLGFSSHAHFTSAFVRAFGISPSALRASARRGVLAELRKNVKA